MIVGLGFVLVVSWLSVSLLWYPSYDEFDLEKLTNEADFILAECEQKNPDASLVGYRHPIVETDTPYLFELVGNKTRYKCSDGLYLVLWDDYLMSKSGLYIVGKNANKQIVLPDSIAATASLLSERVYKWHGDR